MGRDKKPDPRRLKVRRETLRQLASDDLVQVNGAGHFKPVTMSNCTGRLSGCISV